MRIAKKDLVNLLDIISKFFKDLNEDEINDLLDGKGRLVYLRNETEQIAAEEPDNGFDTITLALHSFKSREEAYGYLENLKLKKDELIRVGELISANVNKKDNKARILEKIVESTVGARLRTEAIKSIDLSRKK